MPTCRAGAAHQSTGITSARHNPEGGIMTVMLPSRLAMLRIATPSNNTTITERDLGAHLGA
jgi:hypothetical protein